MFSISKTTLFFHQFLAHLSLIPMILFGSMNEWVISLLIYIVIMTIGGTIILHRLISHRSFECPKWFEYFGTIIATLSGAGSSISWAAIHREHHRYTDKEADPHSPKYKSLFRIQFLSMLDTPKIKYVPDLLRSRFHLFMHHYYWLINIFYILILFSIDPFLPIYGYYIPSLLTWHAGSFINTINHISGYRNFEILDNSTNNIFTGYLVSGEGWHNNHHAEPWNPKFGKKWWEFDLGYLIIKLVSYKRVKNADNDKNYK